MKLQVGEKVRFLNEAIEGIVTRILNNDRVEVVDEFGFTHTAPEKYLVREEFSRSHVKTEEPEAIEESRVPDSYEQPLVSLPSLLETDETIYAALHVLNPELPFSSDVELLLLNNCHHTVAFTASKKMDSLLKGITTGVLKPKTEWPIGVFSPDEVQIASTQGFYFQFLFFDEHPAKPRPAIEKTVKFSSTDLVDSNQWHPLKYPGHKVLLSPLYTIGSEKTVDVEKLIARYNKDMEDQRERARKEETRKKKEKVVLLEKENVVDLHIENLLKDYSEMSNGQIIAYQLKHFLHEMDQALLKHMHKITFIHGVGEGVLKSAIREELKRFSNISYGDAPYEKFGYGATEVIFK